MTTENLLYIIGAAIIALLIAVFHYFYKHKSKRKTSVLLTFLRFLSLFSLFLLLINPKISQKTVKTIKPTLIVAIDNSASIKHLKQTENVVNLVKNIKLNKALNNKFSINYFSFSDDVKPLDSLTFASSKTNIAKPLKQFEELYSNTISPIILISDGNQTFGTAYEYAQIKKPVYSVVVGDTTTFSDLKITQQNVNKYAYLKNKFPVEVFLNYDGNTTVNATYSVYKGSQQVFSKKLQFSKENNSQNISFYLPATQVGTHYYTSKISYLKNEKNKVNNVKNFVVEVIDEQAKIAILHSFLHPDIGALKKALISNKQLDVSIKSINENIQLKDYQLVVLYQPTNAFSKVFSELKNEKINYLIITGSKTDWNFLNTAQPYFTKEAINQTENYLPIFNKNYSTFVTEDIGFDNFSPLVDKFGVVKFNIPYESLLFQKVGSFTTEKPLLATFESDGKKGAVLFGENSWKWRMTSKLESRTYETYNRFIGKVIQYLASNKKKKRLLIDYKSFVYSNNQVRIIANYLDKNYSFDANATIWLTVKNKQTKEQKRIPFLLKGNSYMASLSNLASGTYSFTVMVDKQQLTASGNFKVLAHNVEQQFANANIDKLTVISNKTNGKVYDVNSIKSLENELVSNQKYVAIQKTITKIKSLIAWKWLLAVIILSLSIEWFIRKYTGLI